MKDISRSQKYFFSIALCIMLLLYGVVTVFAMPYAPGETLDPGCAAGDQDCFVVQPWEMDLANNTVFNTSDVIGIGGNPEDFLFLDGLKLLVQGGFFLQDQYSPTATFTSFSGDLGIPGVEPGYTMLHYDGVLGENEIMHATFNFAEKKSSWAIGDAGNGGRVGLSLNNQLDDGPLGSGLFGVFEAKADEDDAPRYGFSFWTGASKNSADHYEFDPVSGLDTKGIFVQDNMIQMSLLYGVLDSTYAAAGSIYDGVDDEWSFHEMRLTENEGFAWYFNSRTYDPNPYVAETSMVLDADFQLSHNGALRFDFDMLNGNAHAIAGAFLNASDQRLKTNIQNLDYGLDTINQLRPVDYTMISTDAYQIGFVAQEMQDVIPALVNDSREYLSINYIGVIPVLTKAVQEISAKIDILEQQTISAGGFSLSSLRDTIEDFLGDVGNGIQNIFAKNITTEELCIEDICFNKQEAETLKQLINDGVITKDVQEEMEEVVHEEDEEMEEVIEEEVVAPDQEQQEPQEIPEQNEEMEDAESEPETQEDIMPESEETEEETTLEIPQEEIPV